MLLFPSSYCSWAINYRQLDYTVLQKKNLIDFCPNVSLNGQPERFAYLEKRTNAGKIGPTISNLQLLLCHKFAIWLKHLTTFFQTIPMERERESESIGIERFFFSAPHQKTKNI